MQVHISPSMGQITISATNGFLDFTKVKGAARHISYRSIFYTVLILAFLLPFVFILTALVTLEGVNNCSSLDCIGRRLGPRLLGRVDVSPRMGREIYQLLLQASNEALPEGLTIPESFPDLITDMKTNPYDAKTFALKMKAMVQQMEQKARSAKLQEYLYRHFASSGIPKGMHCLSLRLADEYSSNAHARRQLPSPELVPRLTDNSYNHFVVATDNVLSASVVVSSVVKNCAKPEKIVFHVITDRKTYAAMHAWFALHPLPPATVEVKGVHQFDWLTKDNVPVLEAMETHFEIRRYYHGDHAIGANLNDSPNVLAAKLQARSPKYISIMNHLRIYLPELFPNLRKVIFLDDDVVVQRDLSPLWDIDLAGKVNGAVETCRIADPWVRSKTFKTYLNFSHPLIAKNFNPDQCAWAYGMNIFDLQTWRRTNIREVYHHWLKKNLNSKLSLWRLGTLPPALIAFNGYVHPIDPSWHVLGLGYQSRINQDTLRKAAVIHYNGQAKPWLEIAFPELRLFWTKYVDYNDEFIRNCNIMES
ncbi:probable galacturonosyltransferase 13 isoform X1 [Cryptomeria japonica]|uniref:probable galacturonosyltransferase 13 isoform X1 n=2 Tax=Cryptomeria japonica TaxID=3369 RepID=UPI0025ACFE69|nr:probable galacturonosyltransferase 13 isoform X1 [Cryptomeria japonica]